MNRNRIRIKYRILWFFSLLLIVLLLNRGFVNQRTVLDQLLPVVTQGPDGMMKCKQSR